MTTHLTNLSRSQIKGNIGRALGYIQGNAMIAAESSQAALEHIDTAAQLDRLGDLAMDRAIHLLGQVLTAATLADAKDAASQARCYIARAIDIDAVEGEHWQDDATVLITDSRDAGMSIVQFTERALTGGNDAAA